MNDVVIPYFTAVLFVSGVMSVVPGKYDEEFPPECTSWDSIKKNLEDMPHLGHINCTTIDGCVGMNCSGHYNEHAVKAAIIVEPCEDPPRLNTTFDIPFLEIHDMHHTLKDGDLYDFPRIVDELNLYVSVSLKKKNQTIFLTLTLKPYITLAKVWLPPFTLLNNATIQVPQCHSESNLVTTLKPQPIPSRLITKSLKNLIAPPPVATSKECNTVNRSDCSENEECVEVSHGKSECRCKSGFAATNDIRTCMPDLSFVGKKCDLKDLEQSCDENEICVQDSESNTTGTCYCREGFHVDDSGVCVLGSSSTERKDKTFIIVTACLVPILVLLLCGVAGFLAYKFRVINRLRERFTNVRRYEVMSIGNDDDDEPLVA